MSRTSPLALDVTGQCAACRCEIEPGYRYCEACADDAARAYLAEQEQRRRALRNLIADQSTKPARAKP
jgi:hypothetical protein